MEFLRVAVTFLVRRLNNICIARINREAKEKIDVVATDVGKINATTSTINKRQMILSK